LVSFANCIGKANDVRLGLVGLRWRLIKGEVHVGGGKGFRFRFSFRFREAVGIERGLERLGVYDFVAEIGKEVLVDCFICEKGEIHFDFFSFL
jgi:hypothetical protein